MDHVQFTTPLSTTSTSTSSSSSSSYPTIKPIHSMNMKCSTPHSPIVSSTNLSDTISSPNESPPCLSTPCSPSTTISTSQSSKPFTSPPIIDLSFSQRRSDTPAYSSAAVVQSPVHQAFAFPLPQQEKSTAATLATSGSPQPVNGHFRTPKSRRGSASSLRAMAHAHAHALHSSGPPHLHFSSQYVPAILPGGSLHLPDGTAIGYSSVALPMAATVPVAKVNLNQEAQDQLLHLAHSRYNVADYAASLSILQTLFLVSPHHIPTLLLLGCTCYSLGLFPLSVFYNQLILHIDATFAEAYSNLGTTYRAMGDTENAEQCYRFAVDIRPEYWDGARNLVSILCKRHQWVEALAVYDRCERTIAACDTPIWPPERQRDLHHAKANIMLAMGNSEGVRNQCILALRAIGLKPSRLVSDMAQVLNTAFVPVVVPQKAMAAGAAVVQRLLSAKLSLKTMPSTSTSPHSSLNHAVPTVITLPGDTATTASILQTLAKLYQDAAQLPTALALYYVALAIHANPQVCNLVGILYATIGQPSLAVQYYHAGLTMDPNHVHLYTNLGSILKDQGNILQAISMYERAVILQPTFDVALANWANAMKDLGRIDEAINLYRRALNSNPNFVEAFANYVNTLNFICDWTDRDPNFARIRDVTDRQLDSMLGQLEWSITFPMGEQWSSVRTSAIKAAQTVNAPPVPTVLPFHTFTYPLSARQIRLISYRNAARMVHNVYASSWYPATGYPQTTRNPGERLRIGYLSSDFGNHPLSHLMQSVFGMHDRAKYHVFCYALSANDNSTYRTKIERETETFLDVSGWQVDRICDQINRVDQIHILVNLNGYTKGAMNEVFAARCAPVQTAYMGFAGTLGGTGWIDYFIADPVVAPPDLVFPGRVTPLMVESCSDQTHVYTEKLIYLPHSYFVNDHKQNFRDDAPVVVINPPTPNVFPSSTPQPSYIDPSSNNKVVTTTPTEIPMVIADPEAAWQRDEAIRWRMRQELFPSLSRNMVILANFNQLYKCDPSIFARWCRILIRVPNAIIWLLRFPAQGEVHLKRIATELAGPELASRIVFTDVAPKQIHISRGRVVDLFLDTPECNAHTTACDILFSGTPIITYPRYRYKLCSRVAASIALATGYGDRMVVASDAEYEDRIVSLALSIQIRVVSQQMPYPHHQSGKHNTTQGLADLNLNGSAPLGTSLVLPPIMHPNRVSTSTPPSYPYMQQHHHHPNDMAVDWSVHRIETTGELYELKRALFLTRESSPLFDTSRWVRNLETGFEMAWQAFEQGTLGLDNLWVRDAQDSQFGDPLQDPRLRFMAMVDSRNSGSGVVQVHQQAMNFTTSVPRLSPPMYGHSTTSSVSTTGTGLVNHHGSSLTSFQQYSNNINGVHSSNVLLLGSNNTGSNAYPGSSGITPDSSSNRSNSSGVPISDIHPYHQSSSVLGTPGHGGSSHLPIEAGSVRVLR